MEYKVRKGIENPCKIHGLLVRDFYLLLGYGGFAVAVKKYRPPHWEKTVTNRDVRNALMKKQIDYRKYE